MIYQQRKYGLKDSKLRKTQKTSLAIHGTALDMAGTGQTDAGSLLAAVVLAIELVSANLD